MGGATHLKSLQALEMAVRVGSLKRAAARLGITPAAIGQRIRTLESYLGTDLLMRGRTGLMPSPDLQRALPDLASAFAALERASETLDFQRMAEIHIVADTDWADLWLLPRLAAFRDHHPNIRFCINGAGDVPMRLGAPDLRIFADAGPGEPLYRDRLAPVSGPENPRRLAGRAQDAQMEGMPLLHLKAQAGPGTMPGWEDWLDRFGYTREGPTRGVRYPHARLALDAVREEVGFLVCHLSLALRDLDAGTIVLPFPAQRCLPAPHPFRIRLRDPSDRRPQLARFLDWLRAEAAETGARLDALCGGDTG